MIKKLAYVIVASMAFVACKDNNKFVINGKFENSTPQSKVYLFALDKADPTAVDSTVLSDKGDFLFNYPSEDPNFFKVSIGNNEYMIIAKNGDDIKLSADLSDPTMKYSLAGAEDAEKLETLNVTKNKYMAKIDAVQRKFDEQVAENPDKRDAIMENIRPQYTKEIENLNQEIMKFAKDNSGSLAGFYAINLLNPSEYEEEMVAYADQIKSKFNNNPAVTEFLVRMANLKTVQVGQPAPAFEINGLNGKKMSLADFKGKYVLLDFWASWCQPCRQENPNIVKAYNTYKNKNFTVFGISLDKDKVAWEKAINTDQLTWSHAGELMDFEGPVVKQYQIEAIPTSFLIDPQGKIIAKNLRAEELDAFLAKTLN
ncbi:peroxiredoxin [Pedobacter sp. CAN_A7]|uniref:redoxin domain-containing protein n=1 Tax=Pedobacter sp. CAN_A7 TaxID=2787722 RepID=UPI0018CBCC80